jgi:hypothetical protein
MLSLRKVHPAVHTVTADLKELTDMCTYKITMQIMFHESGNSLATDDNCMRTICYYCDTERDSWMNPERQGAWMTKRQNNQHVKSYNTNTETHLSRK